jgi:fatty acid desaturase
LELTFVIFSFYFLSKFLFVVHSDADEDGLAPAIRLNRWTTWRFFHIFQIVLQVIVSFFFSMGLWVDHALVSTFVQKDGFSFQPKYFFTQSLSLLVFQLLPLFMNATWTQALLNISIVVGMSNMLTLHAFHISHINEQNEQGEGWQIGMDWGEWQCRTSSNWDSAWWSTTGMLEYQIEHHLFPSLPYEIQNEIRPITKKTCQEFNVPYFEYSGMMVGIQEHLKYVWKLSMDGVNGYGMDEVVPKGIKSKKFQ